jgi:hypothetical protein
MTKKADAKSTKPTKDAIASRASIASELSSKYVRG